ncbi:putative membrane protein [Mycobacterium kansasii 824]|nr:putative membrane protein [Mycobacterium kansasii 824]
MLGYGCLPWVATAMLGLRLGGSGFFALAFWIALAGLTPTGLLLAATVALTCVAAPGDGRPRWLCAATGLGFAVVGALPWLTASALGSLTSQTAANGLGVSAFAPRAETGLGTLASLASLGGVWNGDAVPDSRTTLFAVASAAVLLAVVAVGLPAALRRATAVPLLVLAAVSVLVPAGLATGPGLHVLTAVVDAVPGLGVLRDGQKWVALAVPGYTVCGAGAVVTLARWWRPAVAGLVCCVALVLALPDLAWGVWGRVTPVHYPSGWAAVAAAINREPADVAVLPAGTMRRFSWSGPAPVLDPLPRWVRADVLTTGDLVISGVTVPGDGVHAREVQELLLRGADPSALARAGVGWVVVESDSAGDMGSAARTLDRLTPTYRDTELALYRVGGQADGVAVAGLRATMLAHWVWLCLLLAGAAGMAGCWVRRHLTRG